MRVFNPKNINIRVRIDTENIDVGYLLHIYNFHRLPEAVQEAMFDFIPANSKNPAPAILCVGSEDSDDMRYYIAPRILTEFCSTHQESFSINLSPNLRKYLGYINYSCSHPPYTRDEVAATKLANSIAFGSAKISFGEDEVVFFCAVEKNFKHQEFCKAFGINMSCEHFTQGNIDVFRLGAKPEEGVSVGLIKKMIFACYGNLILDINDCKVLNVLDSHRSR